MSYRLLHIAIALLVAASQLWLLPSCHGGHGGDDALLGEEEEEGCYARLMLNIGLADAIGRSAADIPANELIHNLRILVFHASGQVECNHYLVVDGLSEYTAVMLVTQDETKRLVVVANEASIDGLSAILDNSNLQYSDIADYCFSTDYSMPLPLSCSYEVVVASEAQLAKTVYLVKAATRFDISFVNNRSSDVSVTACTFNRVAPSMYLLPHLASGCGVYALAADGSVEKRQFGVDGVSAFWVDWLASVASGSSAADADSYGWILEYDVPPDGESHSVELLAAYNSGSAISLAKQGGTGSIPTFYLPECRELMEASTFAPGYEQEYTLDIAVADASGERTFGGVVLPNLRSLFRNTHVGVTINVGENVNPAPASHVADEILTQRHTEPQRGYAAPREAAERM